MLESASALQKNKINNFDSEHELIIVSNRCPVSNLRKGADSISIGGLTSALHQVAMEKDSTWVFVSDLGAYEHINAGDDVPGINYKLHPVKFPDKIYKGFYNGYSNSLIWPLFHYFPDKCLFSDQDWDNYKTVNQGLANKIAEIAKAKPNATIWVQDYHLLMVADYLRRLGVENKIGFFLHIPFPTYEIFRILPQRQELLKAMLAYDLIGFHTNSYVSNFRRSVRRLVGQSLAPAGTHVIENQGHLTYLDAFPISVDTKYILDINQNETTLEYTQTLREKIRQPYIGLGVDRLDYTKGIAHRLKALDTFFKLNPKYRGKLTFIQIAVPSRSQVDEYDKIKNEVEEMVTRINGQYGDLSWQPVIYINRSVPFDKLVSYFQMADFALITPLRDGMNLVAKEFLLCKKEESSLILSELAGASEALPGLDSVNPYNISQMAESIKEAIENPGKQAQVTRNYIEELKNYDVHRWARNFLDKLAKIDRSEAQIFNNNNAYI